jgi:AcrR family transcriptional regulator
MSIGPSRRERKKDETRARIFHAAIDLFRERGFEATTIDEITERADVAKGTFFNYFPRKDSVLAYLSESRLQAAEESAGGMLASSQPVREKLVDFYVASASVYEEDRELSRFVLLELMSRAFTPTEEIALRWQEHVVRLILQGQSCGELRSDVDPTRVEALFTGVYYATLYQWACLEEAGTFCLPEELRFRLSLTLDGVAS